jgi:hypothetical protein
MAMIHRMTIKTIRSSFTPGSVRAYLPAPIIASFTIGATRVPNNSIDRNTFSRGIDP